jgi:Helix-turn-helix domain
VIFLYDLASRQSKISFATQRERETALPSFGEKLKQEREKRKITLEQISVTTKIGTRMLQALEEDKFNQLPGGIFNKGFVRAYAKSVGLDEEETIAGYLEATGAVPRPTRRANSPAGNSRLSGTRRRSRPSLGCSRRRLADRSFRFGSVGPVQQIGQQIRRNQKPTFFSGRRGKR